MKLYEISHNIYLELAEQLDPDIMMDDASNECIPYIEEKIIEILQPLKDLLDHSLIDSPMIREDVEKARNILDELLNSKSKEGE
jgi:hypothetical protein